MFNKTRGLLNHIGARIFALVLFSPLLISGCGDTTPEALSPPPKLTVVPQVTVFELQPRPWRYTIDAYGRLVSAEKVVIAVEVAGTVSEVLFQEGQTVQAGQALLKLDDTKQQLRLERAIADVSTASAELSQAQGTYNRYRELIGRQVVSEEDYRQTEAAHSAAKARLEQAVAIEKLTGQELRDLTLISPVSGVVDAEAVEPGQKVRPGEQLAVIQTTDSLQVVSYVTEREVNLLRTGDTAPMQTPGVPGRVYQARIESVGRAADPRTGNFPVKLRVDNADGKLREGMSATIRLLGVEEKEVLAIPRAAVTDRDRKRIVYVARDGKAVRIAPSFGMAIGDWVPVLSGLSAGDRVIVDKLPLLVDGSPVHMGQTTTDPAATQP